MSELSPFPRQLPLDRLAAASVWTRLFLILVLAGPWMLALGPALFGVPADAVVLGALLGGVAGSSVRDRVFLALPSGARRTVIGVQRSGQLSGDSALDRVALERLRRAGRTAGLDRVLLPFLVVLYAAIPVVAAARDSGWWLVCLLPGAAAVVAIGRASWPADGVLVRRDRLQRALDS